MNPINWMKNKVINLLAVLRHDEEEPTTMTILPDYEVAFLLSLADAYPKPETKPEEFIREFYRSFRRNLVAVAGRGREDIKEVYTRKEFYDRYLKSLYEREQTNEQGVRLA